MTTGIKIQELQIYLQYGLEIHGFWSRKKLCRVIQGHLYQGFTVSQTLPHIGENKKYFLF